MRGSGANHLRRARQNLRRQRDFLVAGLFHLQKLLEAVGLDRHAAVVQHVREQQPVVEGEVALGVFLFRQIQVQFFREHRLERRQVERLAVRDGAVEIENDRL